jgi:hypothetical protein
MVTRTLTVAICLAAVLAASANAAHAGFVKNTAKLTKHYVKVEQIVLKQPMSAKNHLKTQANIARAFTKCFVKGATSKPCSSAN